MGHFFISIRQAGIRTGKQASGLFLHFLRHFDIFQPFGMLFQWNILKKNVILTSFKCGIAGYIGLIKVPLRYFCNHYFLPIDVFLRSFQVRRTIPRTCTHTRTKVFVCLINRTRNWNLWLHVFPIWLPVFDQDMWLY